MPFRKMVEQLSGQNSNLCYQCSKCSSGCPMIAWMDLKPAQVMHLICLEHEDAVLNSQAIWLCLGCEACSARCPQGVEPAAAMAAARTIALNKGIRPSVKEVGVYYNGFVNNMLLNGRIHDASVAGITQLLTGQLIENLPLAWKLWVRGRVKLPPLPRYRNHFRKIYKNAQVKEDTFAL
jgi:heterodisulfide reductase subunit C